MNKIQFREAQIILSCYNCFKDTILNNSETVEELDQTYYFCSITCKNEFLEVI